MPDEVGKASAKGPKKITVMRVAAMRGRELTGRGVDKIYQAATADGADKSGLTALTLPVIALTLASGSYVIPVGWSLTEAPFQNNLLIL